MLRSIPYTYSSNLKFFLLFKFLFWEAVSSTPTHNICCRCFSKVWSPIKGSNYLMHSPAFLINIPQSRSWKYIISASLYKNYIENGWPEIGVGWRHTSWATRSANIFTPSLASFAWGYLHHEIWGKVRQWSTCWRRYRHTGGAHRE